MFLLTSFLFAKVADAEPAPSSGNVASAGSREGEPSATSAKTGKALGGPGISLGLRVGWAFPVGSLDSGHPLSESFTGMLPVWLDLGYRLSDSFYVGGYFQWGAAFVNGDECPGLSCSATNLRFGANVHWHFLPLKPAENPVDPWVGVGAGYEVATTRLSADVGKSHETERGFEFGNLQAGADYLGFLPFRVGVFGTVSIAQYDRRSVSNLTDADDQPIAHPAIHGWIMLGLRGQYDF